MKVNREGKDGYFSFGVSKDSDGIALYRDHQKHLRDDMARYNADSDEKQLIKVSLQVPKEKAITAAIGFGKKNRNITFIPGTNNDGYNPIVNSCAHAVNDFLKTSGVDISFGATGTVGLLPSTICSKLLAKVIRENAKDRSVILASLKITQQQNDVKVDSLAKVRELIKIEITRLEKEKLKSEVDFSFDNQKIKAAKKNNLENLLIKLNNHTQNFELHHQEIVRLANDIGGRTQKHLQECLEVFPYQKMPCFAERKALQELITMLPKPSVIGLFNNGLEKLSALCQKINTQSSEEEVQKLFAEVKDYLIYKMDPARDRSEKTRKAYEKCLGIIEKVSNTISPTSSVAEEPKPLTTKDVGDTEQYNTNEEAYSSPSRRF